MTESSTLVVSIAILAYFLVEKKANTPIDTTNVLQSVTVLISTAFKDNTWYCPLSKRPLNQMVNLAPN